MTQRIAWPAWWNVSSAGTLFLLLATLLAACGSGSPQENGPGLKGTLSVMPTPEPYVAPGQIVRGPDGNLWFPSIAYKNFTTDQPGGAIGQLTSGGQFHMFTLPKPNSYPTSLTFASDRTIWAIVFQGNGQLAPNTDTAPRFTDGFSELAHMTLDGQFQFFRLPSSGWVPNSIAAGPDGNLWFTENLYENEANSQRIGRMTPAGVFASFIVTAPFSYGYLRQIIAGADGNLWFALEGADANYHALGALGKITPQGASSIIQLGKFAELQDMTVGPDHNVWFTTTYDVGQVTPGGRVHLFDPQPGTSTMDHITLGGITTGPDGALWFATPDVKIGRVTTTGAFTFYPLPEKPYFDNGGSSFTLGYLKGIATGADGTLWLTDALQIGHFV